MVEEISEQDAEKLFAAAEEMVAKRGNIVVAELDHMEYRPIQSDAARHVAEKIRQAMNRGGVNQISVFGRRRLTVVLDLEMAEAFVGEMSSEPNWRSTE
jgi:hypothetical protein